MVCCVVEPWPNLAEMLENQEFRRGDVPGCAFGLSTDPDRPFLFKVGVPFAVAVVVVLPVPDVALPFT
jgi:hypothetical protein